MINRLNPRERAIVIGGAIVLLLLFVWFVLLSPYFKTLTKLDRKIAAQERNLVVVEKMRDQILQLRQQLATAGQRKQGERPLFSQVESLTEQTGVREQLLSMRPQPATVQGEFRQQLVEIRLEKISLAQMVKLLHAVEYRSGGVQVKSLRAKPRFEDRSLLDVNMVLMSLEKP
ncbi:MAG: type II secretion system protein GspM [Deltaproteobacteria bacterium]|jgi:general secretion pathway protein M|nr:type II secretion system protein GspM [Deltaproteobacteria bacterium]